MSLRSVLGRLVTLVPGVSAGGDSDSDSDSDGDSSVWSAIPYGQWGRHAETGGMTKAEQSDAVRDVQRQADEYERVRER